MKKKIFLEEQKKSSTAGTKSVICEKNEISWFTVFLKFEKLPKIIERMFSGFFLLKNYD